MKHLAVVALVLVSLVIVSPCSAIIKPCYGGTCSTVDVNYTFTGAPGTSALVTNIGSLTAALFDFTIPSGQTGANGTPGINGINGTPGLPGADGMFNLTANMTAGPEGAPGATGGTGGKFYYFNNTAFVSPAGYEGLTVLPSGAAQVDEVVTVNRGSGQVLVDPYLTVVGEPGQSQLPAGLWKFNTYHYSDSATLGTTAVFKVYNRTPAGVETLLFTATSSDITALTTTLYTTSYTQNSPYTISTSDRVVIKVYGQTTRVPDTAFHFVYQGSSFASNVQTPLSISDASTLTFTAYSDGTALYKGQAVYISGATGSIPIVSLANNTNTDKSRVVGLVVSNIGISELGQVRRTGVLPEVDTRTSNLNVNPNAETWVGGDLLFATASGGLTKIRPTSGRTVKAAYSLSGSSASDTLLAYPMENPVWVTSASNEGIVLRLGDNTGLTNVSIRNYNNTQVANINSLGVATFAGGSTGTNLSKVYPIGSVYISTLNQSPNVTFEGFGNWSSLGTGYVLVGL